MLAWIVIFLTFIGYVIYYYRKPIPKVLGIYSGKGGLFEFKKIVFKLLIKLRHLRSEKNVSSRSAAGYGMKSKNSEDEMEAPQTLEINFPKAVDAIYFNASDKNEVFLVAATARRQNNIIQTLLYIRIPNLGLFELPSLPVTELPANGDNQYSAGGLSICCVQPMKIWQLMFSGPLRLLKTDGSQSEVPVNFTLTWTATTRCFDFDTDLNTEALCESIAREEWTREFFQNLEKAHQTHYEQFGTLTGTINIDGYKSIDANLHGLRDHSYGRVRYWRDLHRYAIQYITLNDGTSICVGNICMKPTMRRLIIGYVMHSDGQMETVSSTDLELHEHGEDGKDPDELEFSFTAGATIYRVKCYVIERPFFYMGQPKEAKIVERMCKYIINGITGYGISEWEYGC